MRILRRKPLAVYLGDNVETLRTWEVWGTDMDNGKSYLQRVIFSADDGIAKAYAKRMNGFNKRNDFPFQYTFRERKPNVPMARD